MGWPASPVVMGALSAPRCRASGQRASSGRPCCPLLRARPSGLALRSSKPGCPAISATTLSTHPATGPLPCDRIGLHLLPPGTEKTGGGQRARARAGCKHAACECLTGLGGSGPCQGRRGATTFAHNVWRVHLPPGGRNIGGPFHIALAVLGGGVHDTASVCAAQVELPLPFDDAPHGAVVSSPTAAVSRARKRSAHPITRRVGVSWSL